MCRYYCRRTVTARIGVAEVRSSIRFMLGNEQRELTDVDPTLTVLRYLREVEGRAGTKEGCAEGDCGACTVVMVELEDGKPVHRAINACIQFLPTLDGKQIITVEDLQAADGTLHPVQQAMADLNGSQCGYCTPGFVMSLYAHYQEESPTDRLSVDDALTGNLCRCTGYGPIVAAARAMASFENKAAGPDTSDIQGILEDWASGEGVALEFGDRRYFAPATVDELAEVYAAHPDACILAGGTDVGLWVTKQHRTLDSVIYIGNVAELKELREHDGALRIGAGLTYEQALDAINAHYPDFAELIRRIGSRQIRNAGTIGGNVANGSPIGDSPPALIVLGASVTLRKDDARRSLPLEDFFIDYGKQDRQPGEFVEYLDLPLHDPGLIFGCYKISKRFDQDISAVMAAFSMRFEGGVISDARVCYGGMAATPKRGSACEAALNGAVWSEDTLEAACAALAGDFTPLTDMRASADYRLKVAQNLLRKYFIETTEPDVETRLVGVAAHG